MSFSTRNPAQLFSASLQPGITYTFTSDINGFVYQTTPIRILEQHITTQESQWTGKKGPLDRVYEFQNTYANGASSKMWVWAHTLKDGLSNDGVWSLSLHVGFLV